MTLKRLSTERILRKIIIGLIGLSVSYWDGLVQDQLIIETLSIMGFLYGLVPQWHGLIQEGPLLGLLHNKLGRSDYAGELLKFLIILLWDLFILLQIFFIKMFHHFLAFLLSHLTPHNYFYYSFSFLNLFSFLFWIALLIVHLENLFIYIINFKYN